MSCSVHDLASLSRRALPQPICAQQEARMDSDLPSMRFFRFIRGLCAVLWLLAVGAGIRILARYDSTPGNRGPSPVLWPSETTLQRDSTRATLVMVLHPRCPCSRASLGELAELMAQCQDLVSSSVLF